MCHRVTPVLMTEIEYLLEQQRQTGHARLPERDPSLEVPDAYPGKQLPLIVPDATGELHAEELTWGFDAPPGARSKLVFNTRIETALAHVSAGRGMWAEPLLIGRCLIPVLAFYESWTRNPPRRGAQARFSSPAHRGFLLAGLHRDDAAERRRLPSPHPHASRTRSRRVERVAAGRLCLARRSIADSPRR